MEGYAVDSGVQETKRRLKRAGFRADNLDAMTEVIVGMEERLATKEDLARAEGVLKQDIADVRTELKQDIANVRTELKQDIAELRTTVAKNTARIEGLERAMEALRHEVRDRFESFRQEVAAQMNGMQSQIDGLRGELRMVKWILGGMFALMVPMLGGIIGIALQLGQR